MSSTINLFLFLISCVFLLIDCHGHGTWQMWNSRRRMDIMSEFRRFHRHFMKPYQDGTREYYHRFDTYKNNLKVIERLNSQRTHNNSARYGITKFSDMTQHEFKAQYLSELHPTGHPVRLYAKENGTTHSSKHTTAKSSKSNSIHRHHPGNKGLEIPFKLDLRDKNVLGPVRNQKACGGCWAFSVVETVEAVAAMASQAQIPLSVQEVIDCSLHFEDSLWGCKGGDTCHALKWLKKTQRPLVPEKTYPLKDTAEPCHLSNDTKVGAKVANYTCENLVNAENKLQWYLAKRGPLSVSVDATTWNNYMGGIIQYHCGENPNNHAVVIVGYDTTGDIPFYIVKNSWGTDFGDNGYMYIMMGNNVCGIAQEVSSVQVEL